MGVKSFSRMVEDVRGCDSPQKSGESFLTTSVYTWCGAVRTAAPRRLYTRRGLKLPRYGCQSLMHLWFSVVAFRRRRTSTSTPLWRRRSASFFHFSLHPPSSTPLLVHTLVRDGASFVVRLPSFISDSWLVASFSSIPTSWLLLTNDASAKISLHRCVLLSSFCSLSAIFLRASRVPRAFSYCFIFPSDLSRAARLLLCIVTACWRTTNEDIVPFRG